MNPPHTSRSKLSSQQAITHGGLKPTTEATTDLMEVIATTPLVELHARFGDDTAQAIRDAYKAGDATKLRKLYTSAQTQTQTEIKGN